MQTILNYIYGLVAMITLVLLAYKIIRDIKGDRHEKNENCKASSTSPIKRITNIDTLTSELVKMYFNMSFNIELYLAFVITPEKVIEIFENKRIFPFYSSIRCNIESSSTSCVVRIEIAFTQGCKVFMALLNRDLFDKLASEDILVYEKVVNTYKNIVNLKMNDYAKVKVIHDYLISTSKYDHQNTLNKSIPAQSYTPYGILFNHIGVCQAYAETFMIFCQLCNIECHMVVGKTNQPEFGYAADSLHAWNIVKINGKYSHIDVTFDNPIPYTIGKISYNYFLKDDEYMDRTHIWNVSHYPICDWNKNSWR